MDKRRKYYLIVDTETCTLQEVSLLPPEQQKDFSLRKPLIYNIGWTISDKKGRIYKTKSFLVSEIFSNYYLFNTGYYRDKREEYINQLNENKIKIASWNYIISELINDLNDVDAIGAYNAFFDLKKSIPFTERYIKAVYSNYYNDWINKQLNEPKKKEKNKTPSDYMQVFELRDKKYKVFDIWNLTCKYLCNKAYQDFCEQNNYFTQSQKYYSSTAETIYKFFAKDYYFEESHTALEDAIIESFIFSLVSKKLEYGIVGFPFRNLKRTVE